MEDDNLLRKFINNKLVLQRKLYQYASPKLNKIKNYDQLHSYKSMVFSILSKYHPSLHIHSTYEGGQPEIPYAIATSKIGVAKETINFRAWHRSQLKMRSNSYWITAYDAQSRALHQRNHKMVADHHLGSVSLS